MNITKKLTAALLCLAIALAGAAPAGAAPAGAPAPASDEPSPWAAGVVYEAIAAGLVPMGLRSDYTQAITRAEFCALAVALYELATGSEIYGRKTFDDTDDENVEKAAAVGFVDGVGNGMFAPGEKLTREQAAVILTRFTNAIGNPFSIKAPAFKDNAAISAWAVESVGQIQKSGIMAGVGDNMFAPKGPYTREQSIITAMRLYQAGRPVFSHIGSRVFIDAYIDDVRIDSPIFWNHYWEGQMGDAANYILLIPALEALGAKVTVELPNIITAQTDALGGIEFRAEASVDTKNEAVSEYPDGTDGCVIIDGKTYIEIFRLGMVLEGSMRQRLNGDIFIYTPGFQRTDVPASLEDAYREFDDTLSAADREFIKSHEEEELEQLTNSLGEWINNNWMEQWPDRIVSVFAEKGIDDPYTVAGLIIFGYYEHLHGRPSDIGSIIR